MSYCFFLRSSVKFQGQTDNKAPILTRLERFRTVTLFWIHRWLLNDAQSLKQYRRGALLFFKVIHQISRSHGSKNYRIWPILCVSFTNGYEMVHKVWSNKEEVSICFSRSSVKFQGHTARKIVNLEPNRAFPDCNSSLNSPMATRWCKKLEVA